MNFYLRNTYLEEAIVVAGELEGEGPLRDFFDSIDECKDSCFENSEIDMLTKAIDMLLEKKNLKIEVIDLAIGGELSNQLATTSYTFRRLMTSLIGVYSACSTIALSMAIGAIFVDGKRCNRVMAFTSSHNQSAERQFRNPVEYGGQKEQTQTFTSTIAAACLISSNKSNIRIKSVTIGKVIDVGFSDSMDFGRAMTPAALETLFEHFRQTNTKPSDYDLILTGDLSRYGKKLVEKELEKEFGVVTNYDDCGLILYDINKQNVFAGGSGPGTSAAVMLSYVKKEMERKRFKKVLIVPTGALMNPTMINQKNSIPCIAHAVELEVVK